MYIEPKSDLIIEAYRLSDFDAKHHKAEYGVRAVYECENAPNGDGVHETDAINLYFKESADAHRAAEFIDHMVEIASDAWEAAEGVPAHMVSVEAEVLQNGKALHAVRFKGAVAALERQHSAFFDDRDHAHEVAWGAKKVLRSQTLLLGCRELFA